MPALMATATASTDAQTDVAPLMPHSQGVAAPFLAAAFMPSGNAIPMPRPIGKRSRIATTIRSGVGAPPNTPSAHGVRTPKAQRAPIRRPRRITVGLDPGAASLRVDRLPAPLPTSRADSTTERPYVG